MKYTSETPQDKFRKAFLPNGTSFKSKGFKDIRSRLGSKPGNSAKLVRNRIGTKTGQKDLRSVLNSSLQGRLGPPMNSRPMNRASDTRKINKIGNQKLLFTRAITDSQQVARASTSRLQNRLSQKENAGGEIWLNAGREMKKVRISNGAMVTGMRSDQLLPPKIVQTNAVPIIPRIPKHQQVRRRDGQKVSMSLDHGLTVNIRNENARLRQQSQRAAKRMSEISTVKAHRDYSPESPSRQILRRSQITIPNNPQLKSLVRIASGKPAVPAPHRQTLDSTTQREIAILQGRQMGDEPVVGQGVDGFKMVPLKTKHSLNQRFSLTS